MSRPVETASTIREELHARFPGIKFSVRAYPASATGKIRARVNIGWEGSLAREDVEPVVLRWVTKDLHVGIYPPLDGGNT